MCYFSTALEPKPRRTFTNALRKFLAENKLRPKFILGRGLSGATMGTAVSVALNKPLMLARKAGEKTHSYQEIEGWYGLTDSQKRGKYIIVDDLVETGATIKETILTIQKLYNRSRLPENSDRDMRDSCLGVFAYAQMTLRAPEEIAEFLGAIPLYVWRNGVFERWDWRG